MFKSVNKDAFRDAFRASIPIFIAYVPIGLVGGILLNASGVNLFFIFLMSLLVFSGSAQVYCSIYDSYWSTYFFYNRYYINHKFKTFFNEFKSKYGYKK